MTPNLIKAIVRFHYEWQKSNFSLMHIINYSTNYVFTIREICQIDLVLIDFIGDLISHLISLNKKYKLLRTKKIQI